MGSALYFSLSGVDKASITAGPIFYLVPYAAALAINGQAAMNSTEKGLDWFYGQQVRGGGRITTKDAVASFGGAAGNFDSDVIASGSFARRKTWSFRASGSTFRSGAVTPTITVQVRDTVGLVATLVTLNAGGGPSLGIECAWGVEGMITEYANGQWAADGWRIWVSKRVGDIEDQQIDTYVMGGTAPFARNAARDHFIRLAFTGCQAVGTTYCYQLAGGVNVI